VNRDGGPDWAVIWIAVVAIAFAMIASAHILGILP